MARLSRILSSHILLLLLLPHPRLTSATFIGARCGQTSLILTSTTAAQTLQRHASAIVFPNAAASNGSSGEDEEDRDRRQTAAELPQNVVFLTPSGGDGLNSPLKFFCSPAEAGAVEAEATSLNVAASDIADALRSRSRGLVVASVLIAPDISSSPEEATAVRRAATEADVLIGLGMTSPRDIRFLSMVFRERRLGSVLGEEGTWDSTIAGMGGRKRAQFALGCDKMFAPIVGAHDEANPSVLSKLPWTKQAAGRQLMFDMFERFERWTIEEFVSGILLFFDG